MSLTELAPAHVRALSPYVPGKPIGALAREYGLQEADIVKLASNENPRGMSPRARAAAETALRDAFRYPDQFELTALLARRLGVDADQIVLGNGSNDVLDLAARAFLTPGTSAAMAQHAFAVYPLATQAMGAECLIAPARHFGHDLAALRAAVRADTRLVWIANPNNPTGTFLPWNEIRAFIADLPCKALVVLDQAYDDYLPPALRIATESWLAEFDNLLIVRTFSKIHGLAGLRIGYGLGAPALIDLLNRVRQPFNVNHVALAAAIAALDDHVFIADSYRLNQEGMELLVHGLKRLGLEHIPSQGNFISFAVPDAAAVNRKLLAQGVIVRPIAGYGLPQHLRVSIGLPEENARFLEALGKAL